MLSEDAPIVPAILEETDINDEELMEYLYPHGTTSLNDKKAGMPYAVACEAAEQMLIKSVKALASLELDEDEEVQTWSGADWIGAPAWASQGASLYSIIFRPELYVCLEHGDDDDDEPIDPIRTHLPFKQRGHKGKRPIPTANQLDKQNEEDEGEKEAALLANKEGASQEQLLEWSKGRPTRSRKTTIPQSVAQAPAPAPKKTVPKKPVSPKTATKKAVAKKTATKKATTNKKATKKTVPEQSVSEETVTKTTTNKRKKGGDDGPTPAKKARK
jgi:hypothetical protein